MRRLSRQAVANVCRRLDCTRGGPARSDNVTACRAVLRRRRRAGIKASSLPSSWSEPSSRPPTNALAARKASNAAQMDAARLQWIFRLFPAVEKFWNHPAGKLSGGQKQMVAVARAIIEPRDLLIVDEPSKGLAPAIINNMIEAFDQLKKSGVTILLVEQNIHFAKRLGDNVAVMDNGRVVHAGSMAALAADEALQQSLLGLSL